MAYSDYGGYAYKNGIRVEERSDCVLSPEGIKSTPGQWPGWTLEEGRSGGSHHVILGDGPIFVSLYKQTYFRVFHLGVELNIIPPFVQYGPEAVIDYGERKSFNPEFFMERSIPLEVGVDDTQITFWFIETDNYYQYARVVQPDGNIWTGFSGYGVGAGLEDGSHGYSTALCEQKLKELFP